MKLKECVKCDFFGKDDMGQWWFCKAHKLHVEWIVRMYSDTTCPKALYGGIS